MALPGAQCTLYLVRRQRRRLLFFFSFVVGHYDPSPALVHQPASPCYKGGVTDSLSLPDKILHCSRYSESRNSPLFSAASRNFERSYAAIIQFGVAGPRQRQKPATNAASATCTPRADRNQGFIARSGRPDPEPGPALARRRRAARVPSLRPSLLSPQSRRRASRLPQCINARVPSVPPRRVPLRARNVPTNSYQFRPWLLRAGRPAGRWPRPDQPQRGSRCVFRRAVLVLPCEGAAAVEEEADPLMLTLTLTRPKPNTLTL